MPRSKKNKSGGQPSAQQLMQQLVSMMRQTTVSAPRRKKPRKKKNKPSVGLRVTQPGDIAISRQEMVQTIKLASGKTEGGGHVDLAPESFTFLKSLFRSFDRVKWTRMAFYYKPAVGTTYGGLVSIGVDWDYGQADTTDRAQISAYTPNASFAAWSDTQKSPMVLPAARLMSRTWYLPRATAFQDKGPGKIHWAASGSSETGETTLGELWVDYSVIMSGTNPL